MNTVVPVATKFMEEPYQALCPNCNVWVLIDDCDCIGADIDGFFCAECGREFLTEVPANHLFASFQEFPITTTVTKVRTANPDRALVVKENWARHILSGEKTWEIRGSATSIRGRIAIAVSGTGEIWGEVDLVDCVALPEKEQWFYQERHRHRVLYSSDICYERPHAWILKNAAIYVHPKNYSHPSGAVIWVRLSRKLKPKGEK